MTAPKTDLGRVADVLIWANGVYRRGVEDFITAKYLAECVRLRRAFERNPGSSVDELYAAMSVNHRDVLDP